MLQVRREHRLGWQHFLCLLTVLPCKREPFVMPCACDMARLHLHLHLHFPLTVIVGLPLQWNILFTVLLVDSLQFVTMNSETPQPTYSQKCVVMSWLNLHCKNCLEASFPMPQQIDKIKPELILLPEGFGTDIGEHSWMLESLIPLPVPYTSILPCPLVIKIMRVKRGEPMIQRSLKWNMDHSPPPPSFLPLEVWVLLPLFFKKDLPQQFRKRTISHALMFCTG